MFVGEDRSLPESGVPEITTVKSFIVQDPGVEHLKDGSLRNGLALLANIRLDSKLLPGTNTSLLRIFVNYARKKFYDIGAWSSYQGYFNMMRNQRNYLYINQTS